MRLAIVTDIHHGRPHNTKRGDAALDGLSAFADGVRRTAPDLVLDLGDRITDADPETDRKLTAEVADAFTPLDVPVHHVCGNHDLYHLTPADNAAILGQAMRSEVVDAGPWQILVWRADAAITWNDGQRGFALPEPDLL